MSVGLLLSATRRCVLGGVSLLGAGLRGAAGAGAAAAAASPDEGLLAAAAAFCALEQRMQALIEGPGCVADDAARDLLLRPLRDAQAPHLDRLCQARASDLAGHRARAGAFAVWDAGELADLAETNGFPADRLLAAFVRDLVGADG